MNWMDYKKLLDEQFKIAIELDDYNDKWIRSKSEKSRFSGLHRASHNTLAPKPSFTVSYKKRYTPLRVIEFIES